MNTDKIKNLSFTLGKIDTMVGDLSNIRFSGVLASNQTQQSLVATAHETLLALQEAITKETL